jgi:hypothetical protein
VSRGDALLAGLPDHLVGLEEEGRGQREADGRRGRQVDDELKHWFATLTEQIEAMRNFFRYLAGVKDQVRRLCGLKPPESFVA